VSNPNQLNSEQEANTTGLSQQVFFGVKSKRVVNKIWREHITKGKEDDDCISLQRNRWADVSGHDRRTNEMAKEKQSKVLRNQEGGWMINKWNNPNLPIKKEQQQQKKGQWAAAGAAASRNRHTPFDVVHQFLLTRRWGGKKE
jgi:hypothetical protein